MSTRYLVLVALLLAACGSRDEPTAQAANEEGTHSSTGEGEVVTPPFRVAGEAEGLLLVWFDGEGTHTASRRADIPEARRGEVRVDSLSLAEEARLDPDFVYLADLRTPGQGGVYVVRKILREDFEARVDRARPAAPPAVVATAGADIVIYGASWCGACHSAAEFLTQRGVPFIERDIEREPGAQAEMLAKARAAGLNTTGIPIIDFRGTMLAGFDPARMSALLAARPGATPI